MRFLLTSLFILLCIFNYGFSYSRPYYGVSGSFKSVKNCLRTLNLTKVINKYATGFTIFKGDKVKVVIINDNYGTGVEGKVRWGRELYILKGKYLELKSSCSNLIQINVPIKRLVSFSTTHLPALVMLQEESSLVAFLGTNLISSPEIIKLVNEKKVKNLTTPPNPETIINSKSDLVMTYATSSLEIEGGNKLRELKIPVVLNSDFREKSSLARAEWIKFIASFYNKEEIAETIFNRIEKSYLALKKKVSERLILGAVHRKSVLVGAMQNGTWVSSGGMSDFANLIKDAGGKYVFINNKFKTPIRSSIELVLSKNVDIWFPQNIWNSTKDILDEDKRYGKLSAFKKGAIFNSNKVINNYGGSDYFERALMRPDLLLADLVKIFNPQLLPKHELIWFKRL